TTLTETVTDLTTGATKTFAYTVDIPAQVGGPTAYVGFTGGTGGLNAIQDIQTWTFGAVIDHSAGFADHSDLTSNGRAQSTADMARLPPGQNTKAGSVFANDPVDITNFTTTFTFQMAKGSTPIADGITFTVQAATPGSAYGDSVVKLSTADGLQVVSS